MLNQPGLSLFGRKPNALRMIRIGGLCVAVVIGAAAGGLGAFGTRDVLSPRERIGEAVFGVWGLDDGPEGALTADRSAAASPHELAADPGHAARVTSSVSPGGASMASRDQVGGAPGFDWMGRFHALQHAAPGRSATSAPRADTGRISLGATRNEADASRRRQIKAYPRSMTGSGAPAETASSNRSSEPAAAAPSGAVAPPALGSEPGGAEPSIASDSEPAANDETPAPVWDAHRLISFYNIGWSSRWPENRHVGRGIKEDGWSEFVARQIVPDLEWGVRRFQLHNPFGDDGEWPMELDQYLRSQEAGLDWLTEGFVEAWRPVTAGEYTGGEPVEVIAYMGTARLSPFEDLEAADDWPAWLERAERSVEAPLRAGMTLAFDSFSGAGPDSFSHRFVRRLRQRGVRVYIETWPRREASHWYDTNIVVAEKWWQRNHSRSSVAARRQLTGEVVRLMAKPLQATPDAETTPYRDRVVEALTAGYTASIAIRRLKQEQVDTIDSLLDEVDLRRHASFD